MNFGPLCLAMWKLGFSTASLELDATEARRLFPEQALSQKLHESEVGFKELND